MATMLTSDEYKELNELRRYKAQREIENLKISEGAQKIAKVTEDIRQLVDERKRSRMPDGGGR